MIMTVIFKVLLELLLFESPGLVQLLRVSQGLSQDGGQPEFLSESQVLS